MYICGLTTVLYIRVYSRTIYAYACRPLVVNEANYAVSQKGGHNGIFCI